MLLALSSFFTGSALGLALASVCVVLGEAACAEAREDPESAFCESDGVLVIEDVVIRVLGAGESALETFFPLLG